METLEPFIVAQPRPERPSLIWYHQIEIDMASLGRLPRSSAARLPLEDDDLLWEILLLLPPQPSSLPRASLVCRRWRRLVTDPRFTRLFPRHHHRNPPLLGFFNTDRSEINFEPTLEAPNRAPPGRFSLHLDEEDELMRMLSSRHGLVLLLSDKQKHVLVWDPVTGDQHSVAVPGEFYVNASRIQGAVLRAAGEADHFHVVLVAARQDDKQQRQVLASIYSSKAARWGNSISTPLPPDLGYKKIHLPSVRLPNVLVGDSFYWPLIIGNFASSCILEFNWEMQSLSVIELPVKEQVNCDVTAMQTDGGGLGFLRVSELDFSAQLWKREADRGDGVASWVLERTIELDKLLSLDSKEEQHLIVVGFAEYSNVVFLVAGNHYFMVDLGSLQFKELFEADGPCQPLESVYAAPTI